jgi:hypothetical protein
MSHFINEKINAFVLKHPSMLNSSSAQSRNIQFQLSKTLSPHKSLLSTYNARNSQKFVACWYRKILMLCRSGDGKWISWAFTLSTKHCEISSSLNVVRCWKLFPQLLGEYFKLCEREEKNKKLESQEEENINFPQTSDVRRITNTESCFLSNSFSNEVHKYCVAVNIKWEPLSINHKFWDNYFVWSSLRS